MASEPQAPSSEAIKLNHESAELPIRGFVIFLVFFAIFAFGIHVFVWRLYGVLFQPTPSSLISPLADQHPIPPDPVQQGSAAHHNLPAQDLTEMRDKEQEVLTNYGWIDQNKGVVRVPIDRAMQLLLRQGLPTRAPSAQTAEPGNEKGTVTVFTK